tara:strand:- start:381 stop:863 length:483 start_codon:yes stop_codon:yes gene_type:complete
MDNYFHNATLTKRVELPVNLLNTNMKETLSNELRRNIEGKCINEGYVKVGSFVALNVSYGLLQETKVIYDITFVCDVCYPVEGMVITCNVKNITKAGAKAVVSDEDNPIVIFAARDFHLDNDEFNKLEVGDVIKVRVVGCRFEASDEFVSVIGELVEKVQ